MNWASILSAEAERKPIIDLLELAQRYGIEESSARIALRRCAQRGWVERISTGKYVNLLNKVGSTKDLVNTLRHDSYVSLESVLVDKGIITQNPSVLTAVTTSSPRLYDSTIGKILYRKISKDLFWGYQTKQTRYSQYQIAEPEKAFLDWVYLNRQEGLTTPFDEVNVDHLDVRKLRSYAERFPRTVQQEVNSVLLDSRLVAA